VKDSLYCSGMSYTGEGIAVPLLEVIKLIKFVCRYGGEFCSVQNNILLLPA
jgi:hypothetical protein